MASEPSGVKRALEEDTNPIPPIRPLPSILDYIYERGLVRTHWNPFSSLSGSGPPPNPPNGPPTVPGNPPTPPQPNQEYLQLLRDIFGGPSGRGEDPPGRADPEINFGSCGGLEDQVEYVRRNIIWILNNKVEFRKWGVEPVKGVIFHGPPGSGKTLFAKAIANELKNDDGRPFNFFMKKGTEMFGKYVGETEGAIRKLFATAKARAPSIIFLDELDGMCASREDSSPNAKFHNGVVTQLLGCMDEVVRGEVLVIGATNRLEAIDPAFRRPGRFDRCVAFHLPNAEARTTILKIHTRQWMNHPSSHDYEVVGQATVGYTGADLEQLCRDTFVIAFQRQFPNFNSTSRLNLACLQILSADWTKAMKESSRSNTNVFGLAHYSGELASPEIRLLTSGIESELSAKLLPYLSRLREDPGTLVNSYLIWSHHRRTLQVINNFIISSFVSTLDPTEFLTFKMDIRDIVNSKTISSFMDKVMDSRKTRILFMPNMDDLMDLSVQQHSWLPLTNALTRLRGTNVLLLATTSCDKPNLQEDLASIFSTAESRQVRYPISAEAQGFFRQVLSVGFYEQVQRNFPENPEEGDASARTSKAALNKLGTDLVRLLGRAVDYSVRHELQDVMDLKGDLLKVTHAKLTPTEHVEAIKTVLNSYHPDAPGRRGRRQHDMYN